MKMHPIAQFLFKQVAKILLKHMIEEEVEAKLESIYVSSNKVQHRIKHKPINILTTHLRKCNPQMDFAIGL